MLILAEYNKPYIIESLTAPLVTRYNWVFNAELCDFLLNPITYLEETTGTAHLLRINGSEFWVPKTWHILVTDFETFRLDTVSIESCARAKQIAFAFLPSEMKLRTFDIEVLDSAEMSLYHPMINKGTSLVHPVGPVLSQGTKQHASVVIGPHDLFKIIGNKTIGDVFS